MKASAFKKKDSKPAVKLPGLQAQTLSQKTQDLRSRLTEALTSKGYFEKPKKGEYCYQYVEDVYGDTVVYSCGDKLYAANYKDAKGEIELGKAQEVQRRTIYVAK